MFLEYIDTMCKIYKNLEDGSSGFVGTLRFRNNDIFYFQHFEISKYNMFIKMHRIFLEQFLIIRGI